MTGVQTWSTTASENISANTGIVWDTGMAPVLVRTSSRQVMADVRTQWNDAIWFQYGIGSKSVAPTRTSTTQVTLSGGDATAYWHTGRRVKAVGTSTGTIYGKVSSSSYSAPTTTVNFTWDSGSLSNEAITLYASIIPVTGLPVAGEAIKGTLAGVTLTSPTISTPTITGGSHIGISGGLGLRSSGSGAFDLQFANTENLTANRALTITLNDVSRTLSLTGSPTISGITTTGTGTLALGTKNLTVSNTLTLAGADSTVMTFPSTSATVARTDAGQTFAGVQVFTLPTFGGTGVTFSGSSSGSTIVLATAAASGTLTLPAATDTLVGKATADELTNKTLTASVGKGTWTASGTWTLPAVTLGGAITYGGVTLSNAVTGTGNMVLSANQTLTGTLTLAAANASGKVFSSAGFVATGLASGASGKGIEVGNNGTNSVVQSFDRTGVAYIPLDLNASVVNITIGGMTISGGVLALLGSGTLSLPGGTLLATSSALTNGAAAQVATMTNGPTAGNPTKWVPINDNGTTRYIPAW